MVYFIDMIKAILEAVIVFVLELFYSLSVTYFVGRWAIAYAYTERGYEAYGGEYLLILFCFITNFYMIRKFLKTLGGSHERSNETGGRGAVGGGDLG